MAPLSRGKIGAGGGTQTLRGESRGALSEPSVLPNGSVEEWRCATSQTLRFQQMKVGFPSRWITGGLKTFHRSYSSIMFIHVLSIIFRRFKAPHPGGLKHQTTRCCCDSAGWCSAFAAAGYWAGRQQCAGGGEKGGGAGTLKRTDLIPNWLLDVASGLCDIKVISGDYLLNLMQMVNEYLWISFNDPTRLSSCADVWQVLLSIAVCEETRPSYFLSGDGPLHDWWPKENQTLQNFMIQNKSIQHTETIFIYIYIYQYLI